VSRGTQQVSYDGVPPHQAGSAFGNDDTIEDCVSRSNTQHLSYGHVPSRRAARAFLGNDSTITQHQQ
jgi:hypothetical protein